MRARTGKRALLAAIVVAAAVGVIGYAVSRPESKAPAAAPPVAEIVAPPSLTTSAPAPTRPKPSVKPKPKPKPPAIPHQAVAPAAPTSFQMTGPAFSIQAHVCQMPNIRPLDPPGDQLHTVCWVQNEFGVAPGSKSGGTSYVLGHSWAEQTLVLNPLSLFAMNHVSAKPVLQSGVATYPVSGLAGYKITLGTPNGTLTYLVKDAYTVAKEQAANVAPLMADRTPNRVVMITCGVHDGQDIDVNVIVDAYLYSSVAAK